MAMASWRSAGVIASWFTTATTRCAMSSWDRVASVGEGILLGAVQPARATATAKGCRPDAQAERPASSRTAHACGWAAHSAPRVGLTGPRPWYAGGRYQEEYQWRSARLRSLCPMTYSLPWTRWLAPDASR